MSQLIKITKNYQITIPARLRDIIPVSEGGYLEVGVKDDAFVFKPKEISDRDSDQNWFWSKSWQKKEKEVDEDLKRGRVKKHKKMDDLLQELKSFSE